MSPFQGGGALAGCWLNTGEGGLAPAHLEGGCDIVFQIGTAKFGVRHPRELKRFHVRIVRQDGRSLPLNELYPPQEPAVRNVSAI